MGSVRSSRVTSSPPTIPDATCRLSVADVINLGTVRRREYLSGIQVRDRDGHVLGLSRIAGAAAVASCIAGRVLVLVPILGLPPVAMHALDRTEWFKRHPRWRIPVLVGR